MSKKLNETIGTVEFDGLIVSNVPVADVVHVKLAAGEGTLKRGTIVTGAAGGELSAAKAALVATDGTYILTDDVEISDVVTVATAYRSGHFARNKVITDGYTITAADEEILRKSGIFFADAVEI